MLPRVCILHDSRVCTRVLNGLGMCGNYPRGKAFGDEAVYILYVRHGLLVEFPSKSSRKIKARKSARGTHG
jgi:hypothetical protein